MLGDGSMASKAELVSISRDKPGSWTADANDSERIFSTIKDVIIHWQDLAKEVVPPASEKWPLR